MFANNKKCQVNYAKSLEMLLKKEINKRSFACKYLKQEEKKEKENMASSRRDWDDLLVVFFVEISLCCLLDSARLLGDLLLVCDH